MPPDKRQPLRTSGSNSRCPRFHFRLPRHRLKELASWKIMIPGDCLVLGKRKICGRTNRMKCAFHATATSILKALRSKFGEKHLKNIYGKAADNGQSDAGGPRGGQSPTLMGAGPFLHSVRYYFARWTIRGYDSRFGDRRTKQTCRYEYRNGGSRFGRRTGMGGRPWAFDEMGGHGGQVVSGWNHAVLDTP